MIVPRIALGLLAAAFAVTFFLSEREWGLTSMPRVEAIDTLPDTPELAAVRRYTQIGSGLLPYLPRERAGKAASVARAGQPLRVGFSYREVSILRLPIWASEDNGLVTYLELPAWYQIALINPDQVRLLERISGRSYSDYSFPVWKHMWGWLFLLGLIGWYLLHRRALAKWREETGII
ncbi:MAG: hypothetical protein QOI38_92 [Sphingomonadales bacterium]|jgi:hypothetical protein|nr:hypothetical protein [Sphingomonadales bacterium]